MLHAEFESGSKVAGQLQSADGSSWIIRIAVFFTVISTSITQIGYVPLVTKMLEEYRPRRCVRCVDFPTCTRGENTLRTH